jgi:RNA polymerase sigma-70 factor, ECF subfamily
MWAAPPGQQCFETQCQPAWSKLCSSSGKYVTENDEIYQLLDRRVFEKVFELIVTAYKDRVFGLAYSMVGEVTAAEDVTQEVFLKVWRAVPNFEARSSLSTWIYAITRNTCLNFRATAHQRASARRDYSERELRSPSRDPDAPLLVEELLRKLPPEYRRVLTLYYLGDHSCEEVGNRLDMPIGTVKTYLHRAKRLLAEILGQRPQRGGAE